MNNIRARIIGTVSLGIMGLLLFFMASRDLKPDILNEEGIALEKDILAAEEERDKFKGTLSEINQFTVEGNNGFEYIPGDTESDMSDNVYRDMSGILEVKDEKAGFVLENIKQLMEEHAIVNIWIVDLSNDTWISAEHYIRNNSLEYTPGAEGTYAVLGETEDGAYINLEEYCG